MSFIDTHRIGNVKSKRVFAVESKREPESRRQDRQSYFDEFRNPTQYIKAKLKMLRNEMYIEPTQGEIDHLYSLKTDVAIDNAVHSIIDRYWDRR